MFFLVKHNTLLIMHCSHALVYYNMCLFQDNSPLPTCDVYIVAILVCAHDHFSIQEMMAVGYNVDGTRAVLTDLGWESPAGQMYSSTRDLDTVSL